MSPNRQHRSTVGRPIVFAHAGSGTPDAATRLAASSTDWRNAPVVNGESARRTARDSGVRCRSAWATSWVRSTSSGVVPASSSGSGSRSIAPAMPSSRTPRTSLACISASSGHFAGAMPSASIPRNGSRRALSSAASSAASAAVYGSSAGREISSARAGGGPAVGGVCSVPPTTWRCRWFGSVLRRFVIGAIVAGVVGGPQRRRSGAWTPRVGVPVLPHTHGGKLSVVITL